MNDDDILEVIEIECDDVVRMVWIAFIYRNDELNEFTSESHYLTYDEFTESIRG